MEPKDIAEKVWNDTFEIWNIHTTLEVTFFDMKQAKELFVIAFCRGYKTGYDARIKESLER